MTSKDVQKQIGKQLTQWREGAGMDLVESATKLNLPMSVLKGIEAGLIRTPKHLLEDFAKVFSIPETELQMLINHTTGQTPNQHK